VLLLTPARRTLATRAHVGLIACDGEAVFLQHDDAIEQVAPAAEWKVSGHPIALAATGGHLFVATREGPLWQIDRDTGRRRDLGLGGWWGTLALAAEGGTLYAVTQAGKIWAIDYAAVTKSIVAMAGWESALSLAIAR
jgi:hypothetical protein